MSNSSGFQEFLARHATAYDQASDDYERPPFTADIKEGKNDSIYNAHPYHTKVPPRSIIPYILHYTKPGDLVLDPFCGSGMTGVAAQMCAGPPLDLLEQFSELKDRVGPRFCVLNDLSPAACHIAYNYNTPVDVEGLRREFDRIRAVVESEFNWLYGTEHYEPAIGIYSPNAVAHRPELPSISSPSDRDWALISRDQVEERLGYSVTELPRDPRWGDADLAKIKEWVCIPAKIQYTIWSDVYKCEGLFTIEDATGKISTRGKNAGKPITKKRKVNRGCGSRITLWDSAMDKKTGEVFESFACPSCGQMWKKIQLSRIGEIPVETFYAFKPVTFGIKGSRPTRVQRKCSHKEHELLREIDRRPLPYWYPNDSIDMGREMLLHGLQRRGNMSISDFFFKRQLWALARLWQEFSVPQPRMESALKFLFTSLHSRFSKRTKWHKSRFGQASMPNNLYIPSLIVENNVLDLCTNKFADVCAVSAFVGRHDHQVEVRKGSATKLTEIADASVDYIFADPPFGQNIYYADCSLLWEGWLQDFTAEKDEIVVNERRNGGNFKDLQEYTRLMTEAFAEMYRVLKPNRWLTIEFNNSDGSVFEAIKVAITSVGFEVVNMLLLDKEQKTFKQIQGAKGEADVVDKDVLFNIHKPATVNAERAAERRDLEQQIIEVVRDHLLTLPKRIEAEPAKYGQEHRTTATINSILMNALIPRGVSVERLNLPFIERVCGRYFRKIGQHWYLRGEAVVGTERGGLIEEEVEIKDELTAIDWLRQKLRVGPKLNGELNPLWMRAIGLLPIETSQTLVLENLLFENFWRDADTNRWREPIPEEREKMNDDRSLRVLHDAERFVNGTLRRPTTDAERAGWIDDLFQACRTVEDEAEALPVLRGFDPVEAYSLITRLFQGILSEHLTSDAWRKVEKQASAASRKLAFRSNEQNVKAMKARGPEGGQEHFDFGKA